jgi:hypothetical protein
MAWHEQGPSGNYFIFHVLTAHPPRWSWPTHW